MLCYCLFCALVTCALKNYLLTYLLDVDDYALFAETKTLLLEKFSKWKIGTVEGKGHA